MSSLPPARATTRFTAGRGDCGAVGRRPATKVAAVLAAAVGAAFLAGSGAAAAGTHAAAAGRSAAAAGTWGAAHKVRGLAALNQGGSAGISSVSCASPGNCGAGGSYTDSSGHARAFVLSETNGTWGKAKEVLGAAALNQGGISSLSCGSAGNCSAVGGGSTRSFSPNSKAFIVDEKHGTWRQAEPVPGLAALNAGGNAGLISVSCGSAGNCGAGGYYTDASGDFQAYIVSEKNGTWRTAEEVPGTAALNQYGASTESVSCPSAGNCAAAGFYGAGCGCSAYGSAIPFVVTETNGTWRTAKTVANTVSGGDYADITSLSCPSVDNCGASGYYQAPSQGGQLCCIEAFVDSQANGTWGAGRRAPGTDEATITSLSCPSSGNCSAVGYAVDAPVQAYILTESNGTWARAKEVPGITALSQGGRSRLSSMSCTSAGNCSAGGSYTDSSGHTQAFVVSKTTAAAGLQHR